MRRIALVLVLITLTAPVHAQQRTKRTGRAASAGQPAAAQGHVYRLGTRSIAIPPPSGFAEAMSQSDYIARVMTATEDPKNEVLASHVPAEVLAKLKRGEPQRLDFYTKVSVLKRAKTHDVTDAEFAAIVSHFESASPQVLDVNGPIMKSAVQNLRQGLSSATGRDVPFEFDQPRNLGSFERTKNVYSTMIAMSLKGPTESLPLLCGASFVNVKGRTLYVYAYRKFTSEKDAELLRDFTRTWIRQILAANR